jgi:hypothetical protein
VLYASHCLAQFADVTWQFSIIIFVSALTNYSSLFFISSYGIASGSLVLICNSSVLGNFIDSARFSRSTVMTTLLVGQLTCVMTATATIYFLFRFVQRVYTQVSSKEDLKRAEDPHVLMTHAYFGALMLGLHVFGGLAKALDKAVTVAMEKDWIVVMSQQLRNNKNNLVGEDQDEHDMVDDKGDTNCHLDVCKDDDGDHDNIHHKDVENSCVIDGTVCTLDEDNTIDHGNEDMVVTESLPWKEAHNHSESLGVLPSSSHMPDVTAAKSWLTDTNVTMKQIDLGCKLVGPAISGFVLDFMDKMNKASCPIFHSLHNTSLAVGGDSNDDNITTWTESELSITSCHMRSLSYAALLVGCVEVGSLIFEYICTQRIYRLVPALSEKSIVSVDDEIECRRRDTPLVMQFYYNLKTYMHQPTMLGGLSLSLLYLNVLTFGGLMTAYLVAQNMSLHAVGTWRGLSSAIGLLGTILYPVSVRRTGLVFTGLWGIMAQFGFLSVSFFSLLFMAASAKSSSLIKKISIIVLVLGVSASRIGLYVFDIAITQLMQLNTKDEVRGVVGAVQESLNAFFDIQNYVIGLIISDISGFKYLVAVGYVCVGLSMICYVLGVYVRNDLTDR